MISVQECLRADRQSTLYSSYSSTSLEDAMNYETEQSAKVLTTEAIVGAKKFAAGMGKHGKFNVNQVWCWYCSLIGQYNSFLSLIGQVGEKEEWQKELEELKKSHKPQS